MLGTGKPPSSNMPLSFSGVKLCTAIKSFVSSTGFFKLNFVSVLTFSPFSVILLSKEVALSIRVSSPFGDFPTEAATSFILVTSYATLPESFLATFNFPSYIFPLYSKLKLL